MPRAVAGHYRAAALDALRAPALRRAARVARAAFSHVIGGSEALDVRRRCLFDAT